MDDIRNEVSLRDMLADPLVRLVMARDGVTPAEVEELFSNLLALRGPGKEPVFRLSVA